MSRQIKDVKDFNTGLLVYPRTHISAVVGLEDFSESFTSIKFVNKTANTWVKDSTYSGFEYRCDISCEGVTADMYAEVVFNVDQAISGNYAPVCETFTGKVRIYSKVNTSITIPTILIEK